MGTALSFFLTLHNQKITMKNKSNSQFSVTTPYLDPKSFTAKFLKFFGVVIHRKTIIDTSPLPTIQELNEKNLRQMERYISWTAPLVGFAAYQIVLLFVRLCCMLFQQLNQQ